MALTNYLQRVMAALLEIKDLRTQFHTRGAVYAINGVSFALAEGDTLGIVGESGCGKSVSVLSVMRLIPQPPGKIAGGQALFRGPRPAEDAPTRSAHVRGEQIAMIFQDPMTCLNPVLTDRPPDHRGPGAAPGHEHEAGAASARSKC